MEKLIFLSAGFTFSIMCTQFYKYYKITSIEKQIKICNNLDLSYESIEDKSQDYFNKDILIASSIKSIKNMTENKENVNLILKAEIEEQNKKNHWMNVNYIFIRFYLQV